MGRERKVTLSQELHYRSTPLPVVAQDRDIRLASGPRCWTTSSNLNGHKELRNKHYKAFMAMGTSIASVKRLRICGRTCFVGPF